MNVGMKKGLCELEGSFWFFGTMIVSEKSLKWKFYLNNCFLLMFRVTVNPVQSLTGIFGPVNFIKKFSIVSPQRSIFGTMRLSSGKNKRFWCFQSGKVFSSLMRITSGIFRHWEIEKMSFAYSRDLMFVNLAQDAKFGRSRLV